MNIKIYIGCTSSELSQKICEYSIISRHPTAQIEFIKKENLIGQGLCSNQDDLDDVTLFKYYVPLLNDFDGWALYCDSSVLFTVDVEKLICQSQDQYAIMVSNEQNHNARSAIILWNCRHIDNKKLVAEYINCSSKKDFKWFPWTTSQAVGQLGYEYNWLTNSYNELEHGVPKVLNFYAGGPWQDEHRHCLFGAYWEKEYSNYKHSLIQPAPRGPFDAIPPDMYDLFLNLMNYRVDPAGEIYGITKDNILQDIDMLPTQNAVAVDGIRDPLDGKGKAYDPFLESFILGCGGQLTSYDKISEDMTPVIFRGITKAKHMRVCEEKGRDYYYIDTGYFGNVRKKFYHRVTKNAMQNAGPILERPFDRLATIGWRRKKFRPGRNILICPPSEKAMSAFGLNLDAWMEETISTIQQHSSRPIVVRKKASRRERTSTDTMELALANDVHCLVTFNSIAATEALLLGKPAFTLGPNAAHSLCHTDLSLIETPYIPSVGELEAWAAHLAYCQFTEAEMRDGTAWKILNENSNISSSSPKK